MMNMQFENAGNTTERSILYTASQALRLAFQFVSSEVVTNLSVCPNCQSPGVGEMSLVEALPKDKLTHMHTRTQREKALQHSHEDTPTQYAV